MPQRKWAMNVYLTIARYIEENQVAKSAEVQVAKNRNQRTNNPMEQMMFWGRHAIGPRSIATQVLIA